MQNGKLHQSLSHACSVIVVLLSYKEREPSGSRFLFRPTQAHLEIELIPLDAQHWAMIVSRVG